MIPEGWKIELGKNIASKITKGQSPKWQGFEYQDSGTLFVTSENVRDGKLDISKPKYLSIAFNKKLKGSQLKKGDILINIVGASIGRSCQFDIDIDYANINQAVCLFRTKDTVNSPYIAQFLQLPNTILRLLGTQSESARPNLSLGDIQEFEFLLPTLPEQRKIAEILSTWDKAIALLEQLITAKRKLKQGLMQQLLTGKKRFKEFEGSKCSIVKLSEVATIRRGASPRPIQDPKWFAETGRGWVRIKDVTASNTYLTQTSQYLSNLAVEKSVKVDPGDLIMSICATIGVPRIVGIPACIHDGFVVFRGFEKQIDKFFLYHYINFISSRISDSGQPGTQKNINTTIVGNIEVPKFSLEEQQKIASILSVADIEISNIEKQLAAYKQQKRGLMQQLLTGKKRVKIDEPQMPKV